MAALAELKAIIGMDTGQYKAGVKEVTSLTSSFQKTVSGIGGMLAGAFSVGAIIAFGKSLMNTAHEMDKIADAVNLSMGSLVALKTVAAENGLGMEDLSKVLAKVRDAQGSLVNLSEKHEKALKSLKISADDFVGAGTDEALAMIANAYVKASGSAEAFAAINELFGGKIGRKTIEMLKALDAEGLGPLAERTKEATRGFEELAAAQSKIEKFFNAVQLGAAKAIGAIERFAAKQGELSVGAGGAGWEKTFTDPNAKSWSQRARAGLAKLQNITNQRTGGPITPEPVVEENADVKKMRENQEAKDKIALDKKITKQRDEYAREQMRVLEETEIKEKFSKQKIELFKKAKGEGENIDNMMRIGGMVGGSRPGLAVEDRAIRVQVEQKEIQREMLAELRKFNTKLMIEEQKKGGDDSLERAFT